MAKKFELTNSLSALAPIGTEVIAVAFINNGAFAFLNNCSVEYTALTTEEKAIADAFIDMMKTKVLACGSGPDGS